MNDKIIWDYLIQRIPNPYGVAGLMGNLWAESGFRPDNLQNTYEKKLDLTDSEYTAAVDAGTYPDFGTDRAGYGLAQWTNSTRKRNLHDFAKDAGKSIGDLGMQLDFLIHELTTGYKTVWDTLHTAASVQDASDIVLTKYERPADQSDTAKKRRAGYGLRFYDLYALSSPPVQYALGERILRKDDAGNDVKELQSALNRLPFMVTPLTVDGVYGSGTARAVYTMQQIYGIGVDGRYGPESHRALMDALAALDKPAEKRWESMTLEEKVEDLHRWRLSMMGGGDTDGS